MNCTVKELGDATTDGVIRAELEDIRVKEII